MQRYIGVITGILLFLVAIPAVAKELTPEEVVIREETAKDWKTVESYIVSDGFNKRWTQSSKIPVSDIMEYLKLNFMLKEVDPVTRVRRVEILEKRKLGVYVLVVFRKHFESKNGSTPAYQDDVAFLRKTKNGWKVDGEPENFPMKDSSTGVVACLAPDVNRTCRLREEGVRIDGDPKIFALMLEAYRASAREQGLIPKLKPGKPATWKTYSNKTLHFAIKYPNDVQPTIEMNDEYNNRLTGFGTLPGKYFEVRLTKDDIPEMGMNFGYLDTPIESKDVKVGNYHWYKAVSTAGYGDAGHQGRPFVEFGTRYKGNVYHVIFYGDAKVSNEEKEILKSFKFIKAGAAPKNLGVTKKDLLNTGWVLLDTDGNRTDIEINFGNIKTSSGYEFRTFIHSRSEGIGAWNIKDKKLIIQFVSDLPSIIYAKVVISKDTLTLYPENKTSQIERYKKIE